VGDAVMVIDHSTEEHQHENDGRSESPEGAGPESH
jgi:hypothetical protein